jgi:hypothetical protein
MGLPIEQAPATLNTLSGTRNLRPPSFFDQAERSPVQNRSQNDSYNENTTLNISRRDTVQDGLGLETLSGPAAALSAVSQTVTEVKKLVPTIAEFEIGFRRQASDSRAKVREEFQVQLLENNTAVSRPEPSENFQSSTPSRIESRRPDAAAETHSFINTVNESAGALQAQFSSQPKESSSSQASFRIEGESVLVRHTNPGTRLNITV